MRDGYIAPYVNFQGRARDAFEFYHEILGGRLSLFTFDGGVLKAAGPDRCQGTDGTGPATATGAIAAGSGGAESSQERLRRQ